MSPNRTPNSIYIVERKLSVMLALILLFSTVLAFPAEAASSLGNLSYWYSDKDLIYRWYKTDIAVKSLKLNNSGAFPFHLSLADAITAWNSALDVNLTIEGLIDNDTSTSDIDWYGGTFDELKAAGMYVNLEEAGITEEQFQGITDELIEENNQITFWSKGYFTSTSGQKDLYKIERMNVYICMKNNKLDDQYANTSIHEMGHALGYIGHNPNVGNIMHKDMTTRTTLSLQDINHLKQVYDMPLTD